MRRYDRHRRSVMEPRFIWLLEEMCRNSGVDVHLIDYSLTYSENKVQIESTTGIRLRLSKDLKNMDEEEIGEWRAQEEMYNDFVGMKKRRKQDKKVLVDIGNIIRASGA